MTLTSRVFTSLTYYYKIFVYYGIMTFSSFVHVPIVLLFPRVEIFLASGMRTCSFIGTPLRLTYEYRNVEYLSDEHAYIVVANHQSAIDNVAIFQLWPLMRYQFGVIAKQELSRLWFVGTAAKYAGMYYIDRSKPELAKSTMNSLVDRVKRDKMKLWVFVEGQRRNTGEIHEFKKGAFHMAIQGEIPILPIVYSHYYFLSHRERRFDSGKIIVTVLPPISTKGMNVSDIPELMARTRAAMDEVFQSMKKELPTSLAITEVK